MNLARKMKKMKDSHNGNFGTLKKETEDTGR